MRLTAVLIATFLALAGPALAQEAPPPKASIADAAWLAGRWTGEGMGGQLSQGVSDPVGGQMASYFTLARDGKAVFHQLVLFEEHEGSLRVRVKHFSPAFVGWEEKADTLDFPLVSAAPGELAFRGMTFRKVGEDAFTLTIRMKDKDRTGRDEVLRYRRAP